MASTVEPSAADQAASTANGDTLVASSLGSRATPARVLVKASVVLALAGLACGGDSMAPVCTGPVDVQVSTSLPPVISWTPDCGVARLSAVAPPSTGFAVVYWAIAAGDRQIESGVRFGRVPRGAVEESPPAFIPSGASVGIQLESPRGATVGTASWVAP